MPTTLKVARIYTSNFGIFPGDENNQQAGEVISYGIASQRNAKMAGLLEELLLVSQIDDAADSLLETYTDILLAPFFEKDPSHESIFVKEQTLKERRGVYNDVMTKRVTKASSNVKRALERMRNHVLRKVDVLLAE